jgi:hypothetical protein
MPKHVVTQTPHMDAAYCARLDFNQNQSPHCVLTVVEVVMMELPPLYKSRDKPRCQMKRLAAKRSCPNK